MKKVIQYTLFSSGVFLLTISAAIAESFKDVCISRKDTCNSIQYGAKLISPAYKVQDDQQAKDELSKLGWNQNDSIKFIEKTKTYRLDDSGNPFDLDAQALVAKREDNKNGGTYYLFDFRGTEKEKARDLLTDNEAELVKFSDKNPNAKVHLGFKDYTEAIVNDDNVKSMIAEILEKQKNSEKITILSTGHSLGGASAVIFSAILLEKGVSQGNIKTLVYGTPVPGNQAFLDSYAKESINVKIEGDKVPTITHDKKSKEYPENFGISIEVNSSEKDKSSWFPYINGIVKIHVDYGNPYSDVFPSGDLSESAGVAFNFNKIRADELANNMNQLNSCISMYSSAQMGSSTCFIGYSPDENLIFNGEQQAKTKLIPSLQSASEYLPAGSSIVQAPVDIVLDWNGTGTNPKVQVDQPLDLDSHLVTPQGQHVYFDAPGKLGNPPGTPNPPNAFLYRDSIPDPQVGAGNSGASRIGVEQTRIDLFQTTQQNGEYRFYVNNYSLYKGTNNGLAGSAQGLDGISKSGATVTIYQAGDNRLTTQNDPNQFNLANPNAQLVGQQYGDAINAPSGLGNTWSVFRLDTRTGVLSRDNRFNTVGSLTDIPKLR